jgi:voltage-gated potassium channel
MSALMRAEHPLLRFRLPLTLLAIVIVFGVTGYMLINGWDLLDSFYMVIITISTVGYTEVHAQGNSGRMFTSALIVFGVATMLYGFGVFAETLADNTFGRYRRERQLQRDLNHLRDHFIICGYGRMGTQIVDEFEDHKVPYVVIDQTEEALERIRAEGRLHIEGDASKEDVLRNAGIERARGLVSAVDSDERAVYIVLAARALNPKLYIVARGGRPESLRRLELAGATRTVSPYVMAGHRMAELAIRPALVDVLDSLHHGEAGIGVEELVVAPGTKAVGKSIDESGLLAPEAARILALRRRDGSLHVSPSGDMRLEEGDLVIALGTEDQLFASASLLR